MRCSGRAASVAPLNANVRSDVPALPAAPSLVSRPRWILLGVGTLCPLAGGLVLYSYIADNVLSEEWPTVAIYLTIGLIFLALAFRASDSVVDRIVAFFATFRL